MMQNPLISICIPSYNRPNELLRLLNTIKTQKGNFEIIVAEDKAPKRAEVKNVVDKFISENPSLNTKLILNEINLGFDKNLRFLLEIANGEFVMYFGDDDLLCENAIEKLTKVMEQNENLGVILRAWEERDLNGKLIEFSKYSNQDQIFEAGINTAADYFRKSIFISGVTLHRATALKYSSNKVDGTLLYQVYLVSHILLEKRAYYIADVLAIRTAGNEFFFGSAESEKGKFVPNQLTYQQSINFMNGFLQVADVVEKERNIKYKFLIQKDFSKRSYGYLAIQRKNGFLNFIKYIVALLKIGFGNSIYFFIYAITLLFLGESLTNKLMLKAKQIIKTSPKL